MPFVHNVHLGKWVRHLTLQDYATPTKERKMRGAHVTGYQDITVRHYFEMDLEEVKDEEDARLQAEDKIGNDCVQTYATDTSEEDWDDVVVEEVMLDKAFYTATVYLSSIEAINEEEVRDIVTDMVADCTLSDITDIQEQS